MLEPKSERTLRARSRAYVSWAKTEDRPKRTRAAREEFLNRFLAEAGGDPVRAEYLRKAYFADLARKSARSRRLAREHLSAAETADAEMCSLGGDAA